MKVIDEFMQDLSEDNTDLLLLLRETASMVAYYHNLLKHMELDTLTGLSGSNKYHKTLGTLKNNTEGIGVIYFDVNDLKYYNDNRGHKAGDLLLQKAAESIMFIANKDIQVFRVGGDEFVALTTNHTMDDLEKVLEKWRDNLAVLNTRNDDIHCSIAVGFAVGNKGDDINSILKLADERMYKNKQLIKSQKKKTDNCLFSK